MSDEEIIALYFARDEQALAQTDAKYGPYCFSLANAILPSREDAEEALESYAEAFDFTVQPQEVSPEALAQTDARQAAYDNAWQSSTRNASTVMRSWATIPESKTG